MCPFFCYNYILFLIKGLLKWYLILLLNLRAEYFYQIKSGEKKFEYRLYNSYWKKRLLNKNFEKIIIKLGYPSSTETDKILEFPYKGFVLDEITHPHFGENPVIVFAIKLN